MEYLMTYGWAILIIAVVLGALFTLGVFNPNTMLGNTCIPGSGYLCQSYVYSHASGSIIVTLGKTTGTTWTAWAAEFVPQGTATGAAAPNAASGGGSAAAWNTNLGTGSSSRSLAWTAGYRDPALLRSGQLWN